MTEAPTKRGVPIGFYSEPQLCIGPEQRPLNSKPINIALDAGDPILIEAPVVSGLNATR